MHLFFGQSIMLPIAIHVLDCVAWDHWKVPFCAWRLLYRILLSSASLLPWSDMLLPNWKHYFDLIPQFKSFSWSCTLYESTFLAVHYCLLPTEILTLRMCWIKALVQNEPSQDTVEIGRCYSFGMSCSHRSNLFNVLNCNPDKTMPGGFQFLCGILLLLHDTNK